MQLEVCAGTKRFPKVEWLCVRVSDGVWDSYPLNIWYQSAS